MTVAELAIKSIREGWTYHTRLYAFAYPGMGVVLGCRSDLHNDKEALDFVEKYGAFQVVQEHITEEEYKAKYTPTSHSEPLKREEAG